MMKYYLLPFPIGLLLIGLLGILEPAFIFSVAKGVVLYFIFFATSFLVMKIMYKGPANKDLNNRLLFLPQPYVGCFIYICALFCTLAIGYINAESKWITYTMGLAIFGFHTLLEYYKILKSHPA